jgi:hypothetical protein
MLIITSLACETITGRNNNDNNQPVKNSDWEDTRSEEEFLEDRGEEPAETQHTPIELSLPSECNAKSSLHVVVSQPVINDSDYQSLCKYTVTYTNTGDQRIWVFVHKTLKRRNTAIEEVWKNYYSLDPAESLEMRYETHFYKESGDASMEVVTDVAPIFATEGCKNTFRNDIEPRRQISYPVFIPCD